jgi:hypothetical protein
LSRAKHKGAVARPLLLPVALGFHVMRKAYDTKLAATAVMATDKVESQPNVLM